MIYEGQISQFSMKDAHRQKKLYNSDKQFQQHMWRGLATVPRISTEARRSCVVLDQERGVTVRTI